MTESVLKLVDNVSKNFYGHATERYVNFFLADFWRWLHGSRAFVIHSENIPWFVNRSWTCCWSWSTLVDWNWKRHEILWCRLFLGTAVLLLMPQLWHTNVIARSCFSHWTREARHSYHMIYLQASLLWKLHNHVNNWKPVSLLQSSPMPYRNLQEGALVGYWSCEPLVATKTSWQRVAIFYNGPFVIC